MKRQNLFHIYTLVLAPDVRMAMLPSNKRDFDVCFGQKFTILTNHLILDLNQCTDAFEIL